jgi:membrane associated rhomboid family serine protease
MSRSSYSREPVTLSFPPFTAAIIWLVCINAGIYLLLRVLSLSGAAGEMVRLGLYMTSLTPAVVVHHGWLWQLATYDFINLDLIALVINMLMLWMFGAQIEQSWGARRFLALYFTSIVGAGLFTVAAAYSHLPGVAPDLPVVGAAAGLYGVLVAFGVLFAESEYMMFPLPITIKAKYMVWILIFVTLALSLRQSSAWMAVPQLGGIIFGYLFVKAQQRRRVAAAYAGRAYAAPGDTSRAPLLTRWRDSYYRWKRRRAARKFEVYMRKYDRKVFFDEHGNYIEPDSPEARNRDQENGKSGWVN